MEVLKMPRAELRKYDFETLREKFPDMKIREVMQEYVMVINELAYLNDNCNEEEYGIYAESFIEAETFLAGFLARVVCDANGFVVFG